MQQKVYLVYLNDVYRLDRMYSIVFNSLPFNRKHGYYPSYFYENAIILCQYELQTVDAQRYIEIYVKEYGNEKTKNDQCESCFTYLCKFLKMKKSNDVWHRVLVDS